MNTDSASSADNEFFAMRTIFEALEPLDEAARARVIAYIASRLNISEFANVGGSVAGDTPLASTGSQQRPHLGSMNFESFVDLYDAVDPSSNSEKALVAGYWLQVCNGLEVFDSQSANKELKNLGHGIANITAALDVLQSQKPALALQVKKSGKSQQSRKAYKITVAGTKAVEVLLSGH